MQLRRYEALKPPGLLLRQKAKSPTMKAGLFTQYVGAGCRTRTRHLMITNQLLYLMS
jgi:hypothetical protein